VSEIKVGDRVVLKSGSPFMTVSNINPPDQFSNSTRAGVSFWNSAKSEFGTDSFNIETLEVQ